jgi:tetratricopeptide (TPR) repeat protein
MRLVVLLLLSSVAALSAGCSRDQPESPKESPPKEEAVVVFRATDGRTLTMADLRGLSGTFQYEIVGKSNVPAEAESLHKQARKAGGAGEYKKAITLLERASSLAPAWPYPVYDTAFTYLLMKDADNARKYYRKTVELAPRGFFTAITALDALDRESKGDLPAGTYLAYLSLEWMDNPGKKAEAVRQLVKRVPGFAPVWKEQAMQVESDAEKLAAIEKGLAANPDSETKGILLINKALIMDRSEDHEAAVRLLGELALDPASTNATEHLAKVTLANIAKK